MSISIHNLKFTDAKELSVDLEFIIACNRVSGNELIKIVLENEDTKDKFRSSASRLLKSIKKDGIIQLFVFENELTASEKTESVYLLNKFPFLSESIEQNSCSVYIKL